MKQVHTSVFFHYDILEELDAGIVLSGAEAKSIRAGRVQLDGAYVRIAANKADMVNMIIPVYEAADPEKWDERRIRGLLLTKKQLLNWYQKVQTEGVTVVPISIFTVKNLIKVKLGLARGKKKWEKREAIKKREWERDVRRNFKLR